MPSKNHECLNRLPSLDEDYDGNHLLRHCDCCGKNFMAERDREDNPIYADVSGPGQYTICGRKYIRKIAKEYGRQPF